ncbi:MAG: hypothetical protein ABI286_05625 [Edaphobacter sp.]
MNHALVFQEGFTQNGPRTYSVLDGIPPRETERWQEDWPVGTMDRKFGEHTIAFMLCQQELRTSNIIYAGAKRHCAMELKARDGAVWESPLQQNETAAIVGVLANGSVVGQINVPRRKAGQLVLWQKGQPAELLPWIPQNYSGSVESSVADMSRYAVFAIDDDPRCEEQGTHCSDDGRWIVFDRRSQTPIMNRVFPKSGRAALSPDGLHYASFESGQLRIYSLPKLDH